MCIQTCVYMNVYMYTQWKRIFSEAQSGNCKISESIFKLKRFYVLYQNWCWHLAQIILLTSKARQFLPAAGEISNTIGRYPFLWRIVLGEEETLSRWESPWPGGFVQVHAHTHTHKPPNLYSQESMIEYQRYKRPTHLTLGWESLCV